MGYAPFSYRSRPMAGRDYVREVTKTPGYTHIVNIPVEYE